MREPSPRARITAFVVAAICYARFGVSAENVVATIDAPTSHHGADRPDVKNSAVLEPARFASTMAGRNDTTIDTRTMIQSKVVRVTAGR